MDASYSVEMTMRDQTKFKPNRQKASIVVDTAERGGVAAIVATCRCNAHVDLTTRRQNRLRTLCIPRKKKKRKGETNEN